MSIYATKYIIDEDTGEAVLVKHLNKTRVDHVSVRPRVGGWNKSGRSKRIQKSFDQRYGSVYRKNASREISKKVSNDELEGE